LKLHKEGVERRKVRGLVLLGELAAVIVAGVAMVAYLPWWGWAAFAAVVLPVLARVGRPEDKPIIAPAVLPSEVQPPTPDVIVRALGIAAINAYIKEGTEWIFPSPVREDGPGWRAEVDLPYGVTAAMVIDRRAQLASGLRRPLGAVWPEPVAQEHAGRLELWVGRADISKAKPQPWPWLRAAASDVFAELPFGSTPAAAASTCLWSSTTGFSALCPARARPAPSAPWRAVSSLTRLSSRGSTNSRAPVTWTRWSECRTGSCPASTTRRSATPPSRSPCCGRS